ncbi:unnamed protein product [Rhizoctonia solani]|uniref:Methyltransferase type 12 domain-containing protein n=1 Tax=Rhizoctonia solani TaxID=456999 RepID=A0A8H2XK10_9AGAM|nr:unnamed protein product [Rhizoctonia solani]
MGMMMLGIITLTHPLPICTMHQGESRKQTVNISILKLIIIREVGYEASPARQLATKKAIATILEAVPFDEDKTIAMDYACGTGLLSQGLAQHTKTLIGVDISPKSVDYYNERVANQGIPPDEMKAICAELVERGTGNVDLFNGIEFDVIVCTQAYHHFEDINGVTKTLASYLKPGTGVLVVVDMIRSSESEKLHKDHGKS